MSNWRLRDWLEDRRRDLEAREGVVLPRPAIERRRRVDRARPSASRRSPASRAALTAGVPDDPVDRASRPERRPPAGSSPSCSTWHRREDKSAWWRYFALMGMTDDELIERARAHRPASSCCAASRSRSRSPTRSRSRRRTTGSARTATIDDPRTGDRRRRPSSRRRRRGADDHDQARADRSPAMPLPRSIVPQGVVPSKELAESLLRTGHLVAEAGLARSMRRRVGAAHRPRSATCSCGAAGRRAGPGRAAPDGRRDGASTPRRASCWATPGGVLPIQGPPGSGKTYTGARDDRARSSPSGQARRRRRQQPQGHRQGARRGRQGARSELGGPVRIGQKPKGGQPPTHAAADRARGQRGRRGGPARRARSTSWAPWPGRGAGPSSRSPSPRSTSCSSTRPAR